MDEIEYGITVEEFNTFEINNGVTSDELSPLPGDSTDLNSHTNSHRKRKKLIDLFDEDFAFLLTASTATIAGAGILSGMAFIPQPAVSKFEIVYIEQVAKIELQVANIQEGSVYLVVKNQITQEETFRYENIKFDAVTINVPIEYNVTYQSSVINQIGDNANVLKEFTLYKESEA